MENREQVTGVNSHNGAETDMNKVEMQPWLQ